MPPRRNKPFEALFEAAPDAMVAVAADGRIVLLNAQAERLFGYRRDELIGESIEILVPESLRNAHVAHRLSYLAELQPRPMGGLNVDLVGRRRDGVAFPAELTLSAMGAEEDLLVLVAVRDATARVERRAQEEQAGRQLGERRSQEAQRLESLGLLAGGIAHDFNNLLSVITSYASFVQEALSSSVGSGTNWNPIQQDVNQILSAATRANELTSHLLAFARREIVQPELLDINEVVRGVAQLLRPTLPEDIDFTSSLASDLWPVLVDAAQIEQVLVNLVINARDAMPGGGSLSIETQAIAADETFVVANGEFRPGNYTWLRVSDTGTGISEEIKDHVFEPFFTTKAAGEGSGLGLATAYGIVTQAGGHIRISSEAGLGTTVSVFLPAAESAQQARSPVSHGDHFTLTGTETILVVDDEEAIREATRRMLERHGYQVLTAASGQEAVAVAAIQTEPIDLLITDVIMPKMLGDEVARRLKQMRPGLRVVYASGSGQMVLDTLDPGVVILRKPYAEVDLLTKVRESLDR